ncbi:hypothetical protein ACS0TY_027012 [Phlomoides rotata]
MAALRDRVLVNDDFLDLWQTTSATVLPRVSSDHLPILLRFQATAAQVVMPFRFKQMWTTHSSFLPMVATSWSLTVTTSNPIQRVTQKLKQLKVTFKAWNRDTFHNVYVVMEEASEALNAIQAETTLLGNNDDRLMTEVECNIRLNTVLAQHQALSTQHNRL